MGCVSEWMHRSPVTHAPRLFGHIDMLDLLSSLVKNFHTFAGAREHALRVERLAIANTSKGLWSDVPTHPGNDKILDK